MHLGILFKEPTTCVTTQSDSNFDFFYLVLFWRVGYLGGTVGGCVSYRFTRLMRSVCGLQFADLLGYRSSVSSLLTGSISLGSLVFLGHVFAWLVQIACIAVLPDMACAGAS